MPIFSRRRRPDPPPPIEPVPTEQTRPQFQTRRRHDPLPLDPESPVPHPIAAGGLPLLRCGPLLRFCGIEYGDEGVRREGGHEGENENGAKKQRPSVWRGTVLVVVSGNMEDQVPAPEVMYTGEKVEDDIDAYEEGKRERRDDEGIGLAIGDEGDQQDTPSQLEGGAVNVGLQIQRKDVHDSPTVYTDDQGQTRRLIRAPAQLILSEDATLCYRYHINVELEPEERVVTYIIRGLGDRSTASSTAPDSVPAAPLVNKFHVPSTTSTMRILFHSCNGFSVGTDEASWSGPALWHDVSRAQTSTTLPSTSYHLLIGGGDQIYSDTLRVSGPLHSWAAKRNPLARRTYPYSPNLATAVHNFYRENYIQWFSTPPLSHATASIPSINMWDDHDIIDGYGSYVDSFMRCPVFLGLGRAAWKYYMVFQHHTPPDGALSSPSEKPESSWVLSPGVGRYIPFPSHSIYARLGRSFALLALDARTERTRRCICPPETYNAVFARLEQELQASHPSSHPNGIKHLLLLLGVPIAYPRLVWLESLLRSPVIAVLKVLNRRFGWGNAAFNQFDGSVDLLDDLDDHWCATVHKKERFVFLTRVQALALKYGVRVSFLSGDVHLAALGKFYSKIPPQVDTSEDEESEEAEARVLERDYRYMLNIISSAITNKPPPEAVAKLLARRNKIHKFDMFTHETLAPVFEKDVDGKEKGRRGAAVMPRRNYVVLQVGEGREWRNGAGRQGDLRVEFRVEKERGEPRGETVGYGVAVPALRIKPNLTIEIPAVTNNYGRLRDRGKGGRQ
ncbi:hypothetical protein BDZ91DRAFT_788803 [Kalaharituber pfeilii]|nr:hypothetical protein BDZ91DRAFT_788803 [Kalaharituber pfeilii]